MTREELHRRAAAKMQKCESAFNNLFADVKAEAEANGCPVSNEIWNSKYKSRYDAIDRLLDKAYRVYWYTDPNICRHNKRVHHRAVVKLMRDAGLCRMQL